jgi:hypothetical protein
MSTIKRMARRMASVVNEMNYATTELFLGHDKNHG